MTRREIRTVVHQFAQGARRAREAGLDGVELHACNGYLFTQFLSSGINDRKDEYGGVLHNRARFLLEVIEAVRREVGHDYHLQVKISAVDHNNALLPWDKPGNRLEESVQICKWVEAAGADALHISTGSFFPHPFNPPGDFPIADIADSYDTMLSSGRHTLRNYLVFRFPIAWPIGRFLWERKRPRAPEGIAPEGIIVEDAGEIRRNVSIPVLCAGGFQTASYIRRIITDGLCDGVSIARPLIANPNLVQMWADGKDVPDRPCSYCNKCLFHVLEDPLGCYDVRRYDGDYDRMIRDVMSFYEPDGFSSPA